MVIIQRFFTNLVFSETLKGITNTLENLCGRDSGAPDEPPPPGIKCGSEIALYKKG